jgi:hypothetical protein
MTLQEQIDRCDLKMPISKARAKEMCANVGKRLPARGRILVFATPRPWCPREVECLYKTHNDDWVLATLTLEVT